MDETGLYRLDADRRPIDEVGYRKDGDGRPVYPRVDGVELALDPRLYARHDGEEIYPRIGGSKEYCLRDEDGKPFYARRKGGEPYHPVDGRGRLYVIEDENLPRFAGGEVLPENLDELVEVAGSSYFRTTPSARTVGRLYVEVMSSGGSAFESWRDAGLVGAPFLRREGKSSRSDDEELTVYHRGDENYFVHRKGELVPVSFAEDPVVFLYYEDDRNGKRLYHQYVAGDDKYYFELDDRNRRLRVLSNLNDRYVYYEVEPLQHATIYHVVGTSAIGGFSLEHLMRDFAQELDRDGNIVCYYYRTPRAEKTYFWYERRQIVHFEYAHKKKTKRRYDVVMGRKLYFRFVDGRRVVLADGDRSPPPKKPKADSDERLPTKPLELPPASPVGSPRSFAVFLRLIGVLCFVVILCLMFA